MGHLDDALLQSLLALLLQPIADQHGNKLPSPIHDAVRAWAFEKRGEIAEAVVARLTVEGLAVAIADQVKETVARGAVSRSYDQKSWDSQLAAAVLKELATRTAEAMMAERALEKPHG